MLDGLVMADQVFETGSKISPLVAMSWVLSEAPFTSENSPPTTNTRPSRSTPLAKNWRAVAIGRADDHVPLR
jgi:hypothetical protein